MDGLPTPPNEELAKTQGTKRPHPNSKSVKTVHRTLKRTGSQAHPSSPSHDSHSQHSDGRHKRVWKACERCRMKKTKVGTINSHMRLPKTAGPPTYTFFFLV